MLSNLVPFTVQSATFVYPVMVDFNAFEGHQRAVRRSKRSEYMVHGESLRHDEDHLALLSLARFTSEQYKCTTIIPQGRPGP